VQVADRWHLLVNLGDTLERLLTRHHNILRKAATTNNLEQLAGPSAASISAPPIGPAVGETPRSAPATALAPQISRAERDKAARRERRLARYNEVISLRAEGVGIRETSRRLGLSRQTIKSYIEAGEFPERAQAEPKPSILAAFVPYIDEQWRRGCCNATSIFRELREKGYRGGVTIVHQYVAGLRPQQRRRVTPADRKARPPSPRKVALWLCREVEELEPEQQAFSERLCALSAEVATAATLARDFARLVKQRGRSELGRWLQAAEGSGVAELKGFAEGVRQDQAAVEEALSSPYSNGQTEGQINRLKLIKRQMYGRGKHDLLRARLLQAA